MHEFIRKHEKIWGDSPVNLLNDYNYHSELTADLDNLNPEEFNSEILYKIVLWKLSRFPYIEPDFINRLKSISVIPPRCHRECYCTMKDLLKTPGIALPMASTILRFLNPRTFQIIDKRAYRVLLPLLSDKSAYPTKPKKITEGYLKESIKIYWNYLDKIHEISSEKLPFEYADRILYLLDKKLGNTINSKK